MKMAVVSALEKSYSYSQYRDLITGLLAEEKSTGPTQSEFLLKYSKLNDSRMSRLDKTVVVPEDCITKILGVKGEYIWLVISEGWCGDAAQLLPVFNKLSGISANIELKICLRDENDALMNAFLTDGSRSIPKLIVLEKETLEVKGSWGPRPVGTANVVKSYISQYGKMDETGYTEIQLWYANDKGISTQHELIALMTDIENALYTKR